MSALPTWRQEIGRAKLTHSEIKFPTLNSELDLNSHSELAQTLPPPSRHSQTPLASEKLKIIINIKCDNFQMFK